MNIDIRMQKMNLVTAKKFSFGKKKSEWQKQSGEKKSTMLISIASTGCLILK